MTRPAAERPAVVAKHPGTLAGGSATRRRAVGFSVRNRLSDWLGRPTPAKIACAVLVAVALYVWRSGDGVTAPQLFGEDGRVFFNEDKTLGLSALSYTYAGYLHLVPRLVALISGPFSATLAPDLYIGFTILIVACTAAVVATANHRHAWLLAATMLAVPVGEEVFGLLTNEQWFGQVGLMMIVITPSPRGRAVRVGQVAFALAFAFDGPFAVFDAPVAAWRLWRGGRDTHSWAVCSIVIAGALVQAGSAVREASPYVGLREPLHLFWAMLDRWVGLSAHAGFTSRPVLLRDDIAFAFVLGAALIACEPVVWRSLAVAAASLVATFARFVPDSRYFDLIESGERYFYLPRVVFAWCLLLCLLRLRWSSLFGAFGLAMMALSVDPWVRTPLPVLPWRDGAERIDQGRAAEIVINPSTLDETGPNVWKVQVPGRP